MLPAPCSRTLFPTLALLGLLAASSTPSRAASFAGLGALPGGYSSSGATDVSADGSVVVGYSSSTTATQAFRWSSTGGMLGLGDFDGGPFSSMAASVSADGKVIAGSGTIPNSGLANDAGKTQVFRWVGDDNGGAMSSIVVGGGFAGSAVSISADGNLILGSFTDGTAFNDFTYSAPSSTVGNMASFTDPGDQPEQAGQGVAVSSTNGVVAGFYIDMSDSTKPRIQGEYWVQGFGAQKLAALDETVAVPLSVARTISANGLLIGGLSSSANGTEATVWNLATNSTFGLGDLSGGTFSSLINDMSSDGSTMIGNGTTADGLRAFIWRQDIGMVNLADYLISVGTSVDGWTLSQASAISADGNVIVGTGTHFGVQEAWRIDLTAVPEPGTAWLLLSAGAVVAFRPARRRK